MKAGKVDKALICFVVLEALLIGGVMYLMLEAK
jgi:hypothetical protein